MCFAKDHTGAEQEREKKHKDWTHMSTDLIFKETMSEILPEGRDCDFIDLTCNLWKASYLTLTRVSGLKFNLMKMFLKIEMRQKRLY